MSKTCFVIMPIGDQKCGDKIIISASELRSKYDGLIKEAITKSRPDLNIIRSDDIASPGTITLAILDKLMNSDYVVADITYPNPNVFYELGIRHTCRTGTVLIKEKKNNNVPFDVFQLRHIDYEDTGIGLTKLSEDLNKAFDYIDEHPDFLDSQVLEVASYKKYKFLKFGDEDEIEKKKQNSKIDAIIKLSENPKLFEIFNDNTIPDDKKSIMAIQELAKSPANAKAILGALVDSGEVNLNLVSKSTNGRKLKRR